MPALQPPVEAPIVRPFAYSGSPFAGGHHRGVDFQSAEGDVVVAPCSGSVLFASPTPSGPAVTLECAGRRWRVTLLPVRARGVRPGQALQAGHALGTVATGPHAGLHLGVRRARDRLGYLDPEPLLAAPAPPLGPSPLPGRGSPGRAGPPPASVVSPVAPPTAAVPPSRVATMAPWPVWAGLALVLLGAVGTAGRRGRRRRTAPPAARPALVRRE